MKMVIKPVNWSYDLETGISWQDTQHRDLFQAFHNLYKEIHLGRGKEHALKTLVYLKNYIKHHLFAEEQFMIARKYPNATEHIEQHRKFVGKIERLKQSYGSMPLVSAMKLCCDLNEWFLNHVKVHDKELGAFLKSKYEAEVAEIVS